MEEDRGLGSSALGHLVIIIGIIGGILLAFGFVLSIYRFSNGNTVAFLGLITIVLALIIYVVATNGIDREIGIFYDPRDL